MNFYKTVILIMCTMILSFCSCKTVNNKQYKQAVVTCVLPTDPNDVEYLYEVNTGDKITRMPSKDKVENGDIVIVEIRLKKVGSVCQ